jgi:NitT/TauT family transport system substrate-binding protein
MGVLHLVTNDASLDSFDDLKGQTLYVPTQGANPEYVTTAICQANGLTVGEDVTLDFSYNTPADLMGAVGAGLVTYAVLPEPMVTIALTKNADYRVAFDLTAEWNKVYDEDTLMQGCVVVRTEFAQAYPEAVNTFLAEYEASITAAVADPAAAGEQIAAQGIFAQAPVATKAIPRCNLCCLTGDALKAGLNAFYEILFELNPKSVGGQIPDDGFYFAAN